ncbi:hypothetical protein CANARDRAFT_29069 [[Candida] arabinofermentans NRRL YB-2248]|uniref:Uncharacterized protein n=1 Tax=[Candida] arabinofermentans NRRL YB-2248 TaxID=983967 RepID=A0A1E4SYJ8_9ASCO|nr:hypothetical protein CANARDRAFT_29069 [[Candida] arabinofermentans NRRL YB-2248]
MSQIVLNSNSNSINGQNGTSNHHQQISSPVLSSSTAPAQLNTSPGVTSPLSNSGYFTVDVSSQTKFRNHYQLAIKQYLNRNFERAWFITSPLIDDIISTKNEKNRIDDDLIVKIYKLYLSLIDLILKEKDSSSSSHSNDPTEVQPSNTFPTIKANEFNNLQNKFQDGLLFDQITRIYAQNLINVDPELILMCLIIELSNGFSLTRLNEQVEYYLTQTYILPNGEGLGDYSDASTVSRKEKIVEFYLFHILTKMNEISKSKDLIRKLFIRDDAKVEAYLKNLNLAIENQKQEKVKEHEQQQQQQRSQQQQQQELQDVEHRHFKPTTFKEDPSATKKKVKKVKKKIIKKSQSPTEKNEITTKSDTKQTVTGISPILDFFKRYILISREDNIYNSLIKPGILLVFVVSILVSMSRRKERFRQFLLWLLVKLRETLGMAFKISYV